MSLLETLYIISLNFKINLSNIPKNLLIEVHADIKGIPAYRDLDGQKLQVKISAKTKTWLSAHWDQANMK